MSAGPSDEELMQMLQRGDAAALGTIYERHAEKVCALTFWPLKALTNKIEI
jgi:hypothetical protein